MVHQLLRDYVGGKWVDSLAKSTQPVRNPATAEVLAEVPLGGAPDIDRAAKIAHAAYQSWRTVPAVNRARYLFELKHLLEKNAEELARTVTRENGKTLDESRGSVRRGIECVEVAAGAPSLLMGQVLEDVAKGIDCESIRQPMGVFACIAPFNFRRWFRCGSIPSRSRAGTRSSASPASKSRSARSSSSSSCTRPASRPACSTS